MDYIVINKTVLELSINSIKEKLAQSDELEHQEDWIDDPTLTRAVKTADACDNKSYPSALDIAGITDVPMHHPDSIYLRYGTDLHNS